MPRFKDFYVPSWAVPLYLELGFWVNAGELLPDIEHASKHNDLTGEALENWQKRAYALENKIKFNS